MNNLHLMNAANVNLPQFAEGGAWPGALQWWRGEDWVWFPHLIAGPGCSAWYQGISLQPNLDRGIKHC